MTASKYRVKSHHVVSLLRIAFLTIAISLARDGGSPVAATVRLQAATATLSGTVLDESGAVISNVDITITSVGTGFRRQAATNSEGYFAVSLLPPDHYTVIARHEGFATVEIKGVVLNVNDQRSLRIQLKVGQVSESITVEGATLVKTESAAVSTLVDRRFVENLPLNGRSFNTLIELTPGVVLTKADYANQGQFSVNGQRSNANYFIIDGVGANIGIGGGILLNQTGGGTVPAFTALGGTNNLVSVDALQEFSIQTSTYAPEFGRTPGAQVSIITRSGTNEFHGSLFEYFRNEALDANNWFANKRGLKKPPLRQSDFGGVAGGPMIKNRAFFFFSYEGLRLCLPKVSILPVPTLATRQNAAPQIQPYLKAFPFPNGRDFGDGFAEFVASYANPSNIDAVSLRVDYNVSSKLTVFGRYNHAPSEIAERSLANLNKTLFSTDTITLGATQILTNRISNDFRANYSRARAASYSALDEFGGAAPPPDSILFPDFTSRRDAGFAFILSNALYAVGKNADNYQRQINLVDNLSVVAGQHQLRFGVDYRLLFPISDVARYSQQAGFFNLNSLMTGNASVVFVWANSGRLFPLFQNFSAYGQDTWRATSRLTLTYGLRWEINTPPTERNGNDALTVIGLDDPATMTLAPRGTPLWKTSYNNFAPRVGLAYVVSQARGRETVLRGGFGVFYDLGIGNSGNAINSLANTATKRLTGVPFPLAPAHAAPPTFSLNPPFTLFFISDPNLDLPRTYEWNVSVERALGERQTLSASYVAAAGRRLLRQEILANANPNFGAVRVTRNTATSDYHALQIQFTRPLSRGLQALAAYTWSHSIDIASSDFAFNPPVTRTDPKIDRGSSDFDVRHSFTAALTYDLSSRTENNFAGAVLRNWSVDAIFRARTATPVNPVFFNRLFGVFAVKRPNLVPGVPLYVDDPTAAGGRRINRDAFVAPPLNQQGALGRNSLRGFPASQLDFSLRRRFRLAERYSLHMRIDFFNLFNHPNFGDPDSLLESPTFGESVQMLGQSLGSGGIEAGFSPLYQIGGPRSIQLSLKLQF
ncbi:MAG: carboxypeptidase regulatory-like domain-containing protein [Acidobacteriota bacterium]